MGILDKLFGNKYYELKEFQKNLTLTNFLGIDLTNSPNDRWEQDEDFKNDDGETIFCYHIEDLDYGKFFFPRCKAQVSKNATIFIFHRKSPVDKALDFLYKINGCLEYNGNYNFEKCKNTYYNRLRECYTLVEWEKDNLIIRYQRNPNSFDSQLYVFVPFSNQSCIKDRNLDGNDRKYDCTYQISYIDSQGKRQEKTIKNANFSSFVVGIKYRENWEELVAKLTDGKKLHLKTDPENKFDSSAIAVYNGEEHLGYIPKKDIPAVHWCMDGEKIDAEIEYVDEDYVSLIIPATFQKLAECNGNELEGVRFSKTERTKFEIGAYQETRKVISQQEFLDGVRQQKYNL